MVSAKSLMSVIEVFQTSQAIMTANNLGVFRLLESGPISADEVAEELEIPHRGVARLLESLTHMGIVRAQRGHNGKSYYRLTPVSLRSFGTKGGIKAWTEHCRTLFHLWSELPRSIKEGNAVLKETHDIDVDSYARGMMESYILSQRKLHDVVDLSGDVRLLDVGGGAGHYTIFAANRHPKLRGTIFDRPEIIEVARKIIAECDLEDRVSLYPGDIMHSEWPSGFNAVLLSNVLHGKSDPELQEIIAKAFSVLDSSGRILVNEWLKDSSKAASLFDLTLLLCTKEGRVRSRQELNDAARNAGFTSLRWKRLTNAQWVMEGLKR